MTDPSALSVIGGFLAALLAIAALTIATNLIWQRYGDRIAPREPAKPAPRCQITTGCIYPGLIPVYVLTTNGLVHTYACVGCHDNGLVRGRLVNANEFDRITEQPGKAEAS